MVKYIIYLLLAFLLIDHLWSHYGPKIINTVASEFTNKPTRVIEEGEERKSIIDGVMEKLKRALERR
ncbi:MAG: hypothetical protein ACK4SM_04335 [Aquificaceae bacterium]